MIKLIPLAILTLSHVLVSAQTSISGKVKDNKGKPVAGASIAIKDSYDGGTSDSLGHFKFTTNEKGEQLLLITSIGYKLTEQKITIGSSPVQMDILMKEEPNELTAVTITAGTFEASDRKRAAVVLDPIDIVTTAGANADLTQALKTLPGAQQVGESEGLFVRGGTAAETKIFIDGTLVNRFFYNSAPNVAGYARFSPFLFKGTVFSTGGYSALYGQALSSAVILESIDLPDQSSATLGVSVLSLNGGFQQVNKKKTASWGIDYNYTNLALAFAVIKQQQDYYKTPEIHDINANFRFKTSPTGFVKYYGNFSANKFGFHTPSIDTSGYLDQFGMKNKYMFHNLSWKDNLGSGWKFALGTSYTNSKDDVKSRLQDETEHDVVIPGLEFKNFDVLATGNYFNAKLVIEKRLYGLSAIRFGSEYNYLNDKSDFTAYTGSKYNISLKENIVAAFGEGDIYITNALAAKIGGRLEHSSTLDRYNFAPRVSVAYKTGKGAQASVAYGIFYQNPETKYLPSPNQLNFMKATHYIAQYQVTRNQRVFRTEVFYKKYDQLIKTGFTNGRDGLAINNLGFGEAKGFEFFWRDKKSIKNFDYWISYSYLDTKRDYLNFPYAANPNFAARHTASLIVKKFVLPWKTGFNVGYNYASSRPYYHIGYDGSEYKFTDQGKVPDYHNVSISVNYIPSIGKKNAKSFVVYVLSVNNIFNIKQIYGYQYSFDGARKEAIVPPSRMFVFIGAFFSFGIDRTDDAINNNL